MNYYNPDLIAFIVVIGFVLFIGLVLLIYYRLKDFVKRKIKGCFPQPRFETSLQSINSIRKF